MKKSDFTYDLPEELIAQAPLAERSASRLLLVPPAPAPFYDRQVRDLAELLQPGDLLGIFQSGAYARTASPHGFLSHAAPAEVVVGAGVARLVRRRGRDEDALSDQIVDHGDQP